MVEQAVAPAPPQQTPAAASPTAARAARAQSAEIHAISAADKEAGGATADDEGAKPGLTVDKKFERSHKTTVKEPKAPEGSIKLGRKKGMERTHTEELADGGTRTSKTTASGGATPQVDIKDGKVAGVGMAGDVALGREVATTRQVDGKKVTTTHKTGAKGQVDAKYKDGEVKGGVGGDVSHGVSRSVTEQVGDAELLGAFGVKRRQRERDGRRRQPVIDGLDDRLVVGAQCGAADEREQEYAGRETA